jgi:C-terminal processing protease CtpA/Prc
MKTSNRLIVLILLVLAAIASCNKDTNDSTAAVNHELYQLMEDVYLWYDHLPSQINPSAYSSPYTLMDALRYPVYDKWSTVLTKKEFSDYFEEGKMIGHGFLLGLDEDENIRVAFVYRSSQAYNLGVHRGWILSRVNNITANASNVFALLGEQKAGIRNSIEFINAAGIPVTLDLTKEEIDITPVLYEDVINQGNLKIGYLVFQDFIDAAEDELDEAFSLFFAAGIDEMVVDLRYNGGGSVDVAAYLAGWLIGKNYGDDALVNFRHNSKHTSWDTTLNIPSRAEGLDLERFFFIGTSATASASELIINGLKPYVETMLAGQTTHGKPVGMYAFPLEPYNYVILPVTFRYTNANNEGDFYNGLMPSIEATDDLTRDFGDPEEGCLKAVLTYIGSGGMVEKSAGFPGRKNYLIEPVQASSQYLKAY